MDSLDGEVYILFSNPLDGFPLTVQLQPYNTLQDVMKLALKVKAKNKYENSTTTKSVANEGFVSVLTLGILVVLKLPPLK